VSKLSPRHQAVVCVSNEGYEASLEPRKLYELAPAEANDPTGWLRVVDESGEDYLYPTKLFEGPRAAKSEAEK
jgi:hypothetical protein